MSLSLLVVAVSNLVPAQTADPPVSELTGVITGVVDEVRLSTPAVLWGQWGPLAAIHDPTAPDPCPRIEAGIYLAGSAIWVGHTAGERVRIGDVDGARDWDGLAGVLDEYKRSFRFEGRDDIELTAGEGSAARDVARAMHLAREAGFVRVEYLPPGFESIDFEGRLEHRYPLQTIGVHSIAIAVSSAGALVGHDTGRVEWFPRGDLDTLARELRRWRRGEASYAAVRPDGRRYDAEWLEEVERTARAAGYRWSPHVRDWPSVFASAPVAGDSKR